MRIDHISVYPVILPFSSEFSHSLRKRYSVKNIKILCLLCNDAVYCDGSYDEFLLKKNVTVEDVSMGPGGEADPLNGSGLGVEVSGNNLARLSEGFNTMTVSRP